MKVGYLSGEGEFPDSIFDGLQQRLSEDTLVRWRPGSAVPALDLDILLSLAAIDRPLMETLPKLALVHTLSDGYEGVDVDAATDLGIRVSNSPGDITGNADSVAEYTILLMLATARQLPVALASIRDSSIRKPGRGGSLIGSKVCIVGIGSIGAKIAKLLLAFGANVTAVDLDPKRAPKNIPAYPVENLKDAVAEADFVVLSVRASKANTHMIDADVLSAMKKGAILINIARGSLVDEQALCKAVQSGHLLAAGLDVEEHEPIPLDDPLLALPQIFLTPHQAGLTELNVRGTVDYVVRVLEDLKSGLPITSQLNHPPHQRPLLP